MGFKLRSGNGVPFKEMGSIEPMEKVGMEKLDTPKLSDKPIGTTKTFEETSAEIKTEKKDAKKAARKEKMSEIGKALVETGTAISRSDLAGGRGGIIDNYDQIQKEKKSKALEDKSQSILNTYRELSNKQTMKDFDEALVEKNKTSASESHVANSDMNTTTDTRTAAEKYKNPDGSFMTVEQQKKKYG